jgi:hypothetical protein
MSRRHLCRAHFKKVNSDAKLSGGKSSIAASHASADNRDSWLSHSLKSSNESARASVLWVCLSLSQHSAY